MNGIKIPMVSKNDGARTRKGRKAFLRAYFFPASESSVGGGLLRFWTESAVAVLMLMKWR
jgi:hypothetical protein